MPPIPDEQDKAILERRLEKWNRLEGPRVGDFVLMADGTLRRFTHDWHDSLQVTVPESQGSFYFGEGYMSYSGALDSAIPKAALSNTGELRDGAAWIFHHGCPQAHNGVDVRVPCHVFTQLHPSA